MSYVTPQEFATKMIDAGESKIFMSTKDTLIRAYMAGAILALAAGFAVTIAVNTGNSSPRCCSQSGSACSTCLDLIS